MDAETVRARIRTMLDTGELPCDDPGKVWAGNGLGRRCSACLEPIGPSDVEFEVELASGLTLTLHRQCHVIWLDECEPPAAAR